MYMASVSLLTGEVCGTGNGMALMSRTLGRADVCGAVGHALGLASAAGGVGGTGRMIASTSAEFADVTDVLVTMRAFGGLVCLSAVMMRVAVFIGVDV